MTSLLALADPWPLLASILAIIVFVVIAGAVSYDAKSRGMQSPPAWGFGTFIVLMSGAIVADWLGAIIAGVIGITFYLYVRD